MSCILNHDAVTKNRLILRLFFCPMNSENTGIAFCKKALHLIIDIIKTCGNNNLILLLAV